MRWVPLLGVFEVSVKIDCKTVVFFANASVGPYSNERSGASEKRRASHSRVTLTALPAFRKRSKSTVLQSTVKKI